MVYLFIGRRYEKLHPGEFVSNRSSANPVLLENHWQDPTPEELMKHDTIHQLQVFLTKCYTLYNTSLIMQTCYFSLVITRMALLVKISIQLY